MPKKPSEATQLRTAKSELNKLREQYKQLDLLASALREQDQAQIARLVEKGCSVVSSFAALDMAKLEGNDDKIDLCSISASNFMEELIHALSATQQTADDFLAEVRAKALEDAAEWFYNETEYAAAEGETFERPELILNRMAAEQRKQAGQPEGNGGVK